MKKCLFTLVFSITSLMAARAQEYKVHKSNGKLILNLSTALIEGYDGNEIIFSSQRKAAAVDPRAKGLQTINGSGYSDNTGLGISVIEKGTTIEVNEVWSDLDIKILVPKGIILSFVCHRKPDSGKVVCRNMENEIEIESDYDDVSLEHVTGPITVRTLYGSIDAVFSQHVKGPVSMASIHSAVDVAIPVDTKANIKLKSAQSTIMTSPDFKIEVEKSNEDSVAFYGSLIYGKLNGGGSPLRLSSEYGKIYLRTTK